MEKKLLHLKIFTLTDVTIRKNTLEHKSSTGEALKSNDITWSTLHDIIFHSHRIPYYFSLVMNEKYIKYTYNIIHININNI